MLAVTPYRTDLVVDEPTREKCVCLADFGTTTPAQRRWDSAVRNDTATTTALISLSERATSQGQETMRWWRAAMETQIRVCNVSNILI